MSVKDRLPLNIIKAKNQVALTEAFYSVFLLGLELEIRNDIPSYGTDGRKIYINPSSPIIQNWTVDHHIFAFMHECLHIMTGDMWFWRELGLDHKLGNMAADYYNNLQLFHEHKIPPPFVLLDNKYEGWSKVEIYKDLQKNGGPGGNGNNKKPNPFGDDVIPSNSDDPQLKADIAVRIKQAANVAKQMGQGIPQWAQDIITEISKPKVDWRKRLFNMMSTTNTRDDYSYRRHNRRYIPHHIIAPSLWNLDNTMGTVVCSVDTSGSISTEELNQIWGEIVSIITLCRPTTIHILDIDSEVRHHRTLRGDELLPAQITVHGRGGTDFRPAFDYIDNKQLRPTVHIYLTDLEGEFPSKKYNFPTIWVSTTKKSAPFGETIHIDVGGK